MGRRTRAVLALTVVAGTAVLLSLGTASADPLRSTSTSVSCPTVALIGQTAACTATVADTDAGSAVTPTGAIEFFAPGTHGLVERARCTLSAGACQVTYRGDTLGVRTITAEYEGDSQHAPSSGTGQLFVTAPIGPGPPLHCHVPRLRGKSLAAAKVRLRQWGCSSGKIERAFSKRVRRGRVISEKPGPGKQLAERAKVDLVVSKGKRHARP
ncbi:MAG TPA: Ig-like domain repeat protein [Gaiellales bacterium]|nr:Ig-like domain repeat protein [Gaiellales bacterium]